MSKWTRLKKADREAIWTALTERQGLVCIYCGIAVKRALDGPTTDQMATIEHIISRAKGGTNDLSNLAIACWPCNHERSGWPPPNPRSAEILLTEKEFVQLMACDAP